MCFLMNIVTFGFTSFASFFWFYGLLIFNRFVKHSNMTRKSFFLLFTLHLRENCIRNWIRFVHFSVFNRKDEMILDFPNILNLISV